MSPSNKLETLSCLKALGFETINQVGTLVESSVSTHLKTFVNSLRHWEILGDIVNNLDIFAIF